MIRALALAAAAALVALPAAGGARSSDYASTALNVLPPGQSGDLLFPPTATDQLRLYDGLTPRGGNVRAVDLTTNFAAQEPDPTRWRAHADHVRLLPQTARWTNRPTFQQVITFSRHRPR